MNSKKIIICAFIALTGCSDFLKGKNQKNDILKIQIVDDSCTVDFKAHLNSMVRSEAKDEDIHLVFNCIDQYLAQFQNKVNGKISPDHYDAQDLFYITNRFFKDLNLSKEALSQILLLKKAIVGGKSDQVSKLELIQLREFLKKAKAEVLDLHPYFKHLSFKQPDEHLRTSEEDIRKSVQKLKMSLSKMLHITQLASSEYSYFDFKNLLLSLRFLNSEQTDILGDLDIVRQLIIGTEVINTSEDYASVLNSHLDFFQIFILAIHGHIAFEMKTMESTDKAISYVDEIVSVLRNTWQFQKTGQIALTDLDALLEVVLKKKILPFKVKFETFRDFYKVTLKRLFKHQASGYIDISQFQAYEREAEIFKLNMKFLKSLGNQALAPSEIPKKLSKFTAGKNYLVTALADLYNDYSTLYPMVVKNRKLFVSTGSVQAKVLPLDLMHSFYIRMLARQLLIGWGNAQTSSQLLKSQINKDQLIQFMQDFNQFGIELKLNDPRSKGNGAKNFLEADILGFHSDGDGMMSMLETIEYLHHLVAEGSWAVNEIQADLKAQQCHINELDVFGIPYSSDQCFYNLVKHNYSKYFANKPGLVKYLSQLSAMDFQQYYSLLIDVGRFEILNKGLKVETVDLQSFVVISTYVEGLLSKYDSDKNGALSAAEIRKGYSKFKTFATDYSLQNAADALDKWDSKFNYCRMFYSKEDLIRESFVFMVLNNGITPIMSDLNYVSCGVNGLFTFKKEVDRKSIINTFFVLKTVLASKK